MKFTRLYVPAPAATGYTFYGRYVFEVVIALLTRLLNLIFGTANGN